MAFINVIKCPYKIWSHFEIIWANRALKTKVKLEVNDMRYHSEVTEDNK